MRKGLYDPYQGRTGNGDVVQAVRHMRKMNRQIAEIAAMRKDELYQAAKDLGAPYDLVLYVHENRRLPVVNFAAGGIATPADAALMMQLGAEGVFVGSGIFKSGDPEKGRRRLSKPSPIIRMRPYWQNYRKIWERRWSV